MAAEDKHTCYEGDSVLSFQFYLEKSGEHEAILQAVRKILPADFKRMAEGKSSLDVLGVGSGGGELDIQMLNLLQNTCPGVSLSTDIVEGSSGLVDCFKALVKKTPSVQNVPFTWHVVHSEEYVKQEKAKADIKKFDFIHMIQMIYYVNDVEDTLKFYRSALKPNGRIMVIIEAENGGWDTLWNTFKKDLWTGAIQEYRSSKDVVASLKKLGMKFQEHDVPNSFDITECFDPTNETGKRLLNFMTVTDDFQNSFTPEVRAEMLDVLRERCSTKKDGKIFFKRDLKMILIDA
ncbi:histamine N-methyltransferase A-like [Synchiropus picturatus]